MVQEVATLLSDIDRKFPVYRQSRDADAGVSPA